jgi:hypothetical protein
MSSDKPLPASLQEALESVGGLAANRSFDEMIIRFVHQKVFPMVMTEITQPCVHTCNGLFICQLYSLPDLLEETDCKEDTLLTLPFCIVCFPLTVDNSNMN